MDSGAINELNSIKRELSSIISELESISSGVQKDFVGIGSEQCSNCIDTVISRYRTVRTRLDNIDTSSIKEGFDE